MGFVAKCVPDRYTLIHERKPINEVESVYATAALQAMKDWRQLPLVSTHAKTVLMIDDDGGCRLID
jgi:hypothetical protein